MIRLFLKRYEEFLALRPEDGAALRMRVRALYCFGWVFVCVELFNLVGLSATHGRLTLEHGVALCAIALVLLAIHMVRHVRNFGAFAFFAGALIVSGPLMTAVYDYTGVNSSLLPFLMIAPLVCGFISGPRAAALAGLAAIAVICFLWHVSAHAPIEQPAFYSERTPQRAMQAIFALIMATLIAVIFSANIFRAFRLFEESLTRARDAEMAKARFLATMSHEIRTPLNGVLGLTEAVLKTELTPDQRALLSAVERSGASLLNILNDVLDLSKIDAGQFALNPRHFDPEALAHELGTLWRVQAENKSLRFVVNYRGPRDTRLYADDLRIRQVVSNLISNALKFTEAGGVAVTIDVEGPTDVPAMTVRVSDTGNGIPEEIQTRIFEPFAQADDGIARRYGGTGLGLSICRRLAQMQGGDVHLESSSAAGSTFLYRIPVAPSAGDETRAPAQPAQFSSTRDFSGVRALVAEDNHINQLVIGRFLQRLGVAFDMVNDGAACLEQWRRADYDVIFMDKNMPGTDGIAALRAIRASGDARAHVPIFACTADALDGEREELMSHGFDGFVSKPLTERKLQNALADALARAGRAERAA